MRVFESLHEAASEIGRDVFKGTHIESSRVQQRVNLTLEGREVFGYSYSIQDTSTPKTVDELIQIGKQIEFPLYKTIESRDQLRKWIISESLSRQFPNHYLSEVSRHNSFTESLHPALMQTFEGASPSYTYGERLANSLDYLVYELMAHPDSRRAYWPIFTEHDAKRMSYPSRIPCSLGYQFMIRRVGSENRLVMVYMERSCDFDHFWLSDVYLAFLFQRHLLSEINSRLDTQGKPPIQLGAFIHFISSLHSFLIENQEVY